MTKTQRAKRARRELAFLRAVDKYTYILTEYSAFRPEIQKVVKAERNLLRWFRRNVAL